MRSTRENVDRLTSLPVEVLSQILSLLPTKFAVRTSILSKRWRYNWTLVTNLDFDDIHPVYGLDCFSRFVDRVFELCQTSHLILFRLHCREIWVRKSSVSKWINAAVRLNVCELDVQVFLLEVPCSLFTCKTLTKLRLIRSDHDDVVWNILAPVDLPCMKTLDIAVFSKPSLNAFKIINGCPVLESLSLEITWRNDEEEYKFNIPSLKLLNLTILKYTSTINKVVLNVPNLENLCVGGILDSLFVMEDLSSLVEATVSVCEFRSNHQWVELLKGISGVKSLTWSCSTHDKIIPSLSPLPIFPNLKQLELKRGFQSGWLLVSQILERSSGLKHLCIEKPHESNWIQPESIPACMLTNLTTMKYTKCKGQKCELEFLEYMLGNAEFLKTATITCEDLPMEEEMQLSAQLLKLRRASKYCEIHFVGNGSPSSSS